MPFLKEVSRNCFVFSPHLCVGFLFSILHSRLLPPPSAAACPHTTFSHTTYSHTTCPHTCPHSHTTFSHTQLAHTQLTHTHNLSTHNLSTHNLSTPHTTYAHTHTQLDHAQLVHTTHNLLTHTQLDHTQLVLALGSPLGAAVAAGVGVAGVALGDIDLHFAWQAWHLVTSTVTLGGTMRDALRGYPRQHTSE